MHEDKLIQRMEQGDTSAADELVRMYYPEILRYCVWHAPDSASAEDAAQETFLKAIRCFDRYEHRGKFKSFLYRIASNTCIDMARKNSRADLPLEFAENMEKTDENIAALESEMNFRQMLNSLTTENREILFLRFGQDLTLKEIGNVLGLPMRTVQSKLRSSLKMLKNSMREGEFK